MHRTTKNTRVALRRQTLKTLSAESLARVTGAFEYTITNAATGCPPEGDSSGPACAGWTDVNCSDGMGLCVVM